MGYFKVFRFARARFCPSVMLIFRERESYFFIGNHISFNVDYLSNRLKMHMLKFEKNIICKMSSFLQSSIPPRLLDFWCIRHKLFSSSKELLLFSQQLLPLLFINIISVQQYSQYHLYSHDNDFYTSKISKNMPQILIYGSTYRFVRAFQPCDLA